MCRWSPCLALLAAACVCSGGADDAQTGGASPTRTVLVSGATGQTGSLLYRRLKAEGCWNVRALVRNATKARLVLGCSSCDPSEGVYVADVTNHSSLVPAMRGVDTLVVTTSSKPMCSGVPPVPPFGNCTFHEGQDPRSVDWEGTKAQVEALALAPGAPAAKHVIYLSTMGTTKPDNILDRVGGHTCFYHLQAEVFVMNSGVPFTVVGACGLSDGPAGKRKLVVGHDDESFSLALDHSVTREDVSRVLVEAVRDPSTAAGLRFDLCSQAWGKPTTNIRTDVLEAARLPWAGAAEKPFAV